MDKRNASPGTRALPAKIEARLAELLQMGEFDANEVSWCRATYWAARDDWHQILIACYDQAKKRFPTPAAPTERIA